MRGATRTPGWPAAPTPISIHAPHAGRDMEAFSHALYVPDFNPRAPCGARLVCVRPQCLRPYFNPRAPCGARLQTEMDITGTTAFQSTRPMRGATIRTPKNPGRVSHFNPRAPCGARLWWRAACSFGTDFNPRAPCGARPGSTSTMVSQSSEFQSTRPMRGATGGFAQ